MPEPCRSCDRQFATGLTTGSYFLFETAFACVTLALVGVVVLEEDEARGVPRLFCRLLHRDLEPACRLDMESPGWLYTLGVRDFTGGLVVNGAAGAAGLAIVHRIWREEKKKGLRESPVVHSNVNPTWLALAILLLWMGWFGFNPGSVLAFNSSAMTVVLTTFLAAAAAFLSVMFFRYVKTRKNPDLIYANNGILMGLIVITPVAGFVSPAVRHPSGHSGTSLSRRRESWFAKRKWFSDPIGLFQGICVGGLFGLLMMSFSRRGFAAASGNANLPEPAMFGGGLPADPLSTGAGSISCGSRHSRCVRVRMRRSKR